MVQITSQDKADELSLPMYSTSFDGSPLPLTSYVRIHKVFLLNESLISHRFGAVQLAFKQKVVAKLIGLIY